MIHPSKIDVYPYRLVAAGSLNARTEENIFEGVLLHIGGGYGCLHPWPSLGDKPLKRQLKLLSQKKTTPLIERAIHCCAIDCQARLECRSLFEGLSVPLSHYTLPPGETDVPEGFTAVKVKGYPDFKGLIETLEKLPSQVRLRLDFNESLDGEEHFEEFLKMAGHLIPRMDFIEDPFRLVFYRWQRLREKYGVAIAEDMPVGRGKLDPFPWVLKPARDDVDAINPTRIVPIIMTSYMDHPIGQTYAAAEAARVNAMDGVKWAGAGLVTHHLFDSTDDPFLQAMGPPRPEFPVPEGTGLGFDDLLAELPWKPLTEMC